jgi:hypothetical protein
MKKLLLFSLLNLTLCSPLLAESKLIVESAISDTDLLINGIQYSAKDVCYNFQVGDQVEFLTGNPSGNCTEAIILNMRSNESCDVWCQYPL